LFLHVSFFGKLSIDFRHESLSLWIDYEKPSGDRMGETSESIRARVQAVCNIQLTRFANNESSNIVANVEMRVGEIRQFCKL
jgi:predicted ATPase with chaperone activity